MSFNYCHHSVFLLGDTLVTAALVLTADLAIDVYKNLNRDCHLCAFATKQCRLSIRSFFRTDLITTISHEWLKQSQ